MTEKHTETIKAVLARQIKTNKEVCGALKYVYCASWGNCLILVFEDGRWAYYYAEGGYEGDRMIALQEDEPDWGELEGADLITSAECQEQFALERAQREHEQRAREVAELARLRAKYGE